MRKTRMPSTSFATPIGPCALHWEGDEVTGFSLLPREAIDRDTPPPAWIAAIIGRVQRHLGGTAEDFSDAPFAWQRVSPFQREVYTAALRVKSGHTASYGDLARAIGQPPAAARAIGTALGQNPWPLLVPCHRFISASGKMTGFSAPGGIATKLKLLAIEGSELFAT